MPASLIEGKIVALDIRKAIKASVQRQLAQNRRPPGLAVVLLGNDPASTIYVNHKRKACAEMGFNSWAYDLPQETSEKELLTLIEQLNNNDDIDGILVQLPLPAHINTAMIIEHIAASKDVDGFHPYNLGRLAQGNPTIRPCTPFGVIQLFEYYQLPLSGKNAVVVGSSNIVGRPMALEFLMKKATVTVCHKSTQNLEQHIKNADVIVVATGVYNVVKSEWLNHHQIVIDIGMHRGKDGKIHGDLNFEEAVKRVKWITPVPGGVGPMTITMLLQNTLYAASIHKEHSGR